MDSPVPAVASSVGLPSNMPWWVYALGTAVVATGGYFAAKGPIIRAALRAAIRRHPPKSCFLILKALLPSKPKLFALEGSLPRHIVPPLQHTLDAYVESVRTLITPEQLKELETLVAEFAKGPGPELQKLLIKRAETEPRGWLSDWWLEFAYLRGRSPVVINSNTACIDSWASSPTAPQAVRAAVQTHCVLLFFKRVQTESMPPLRAGGLIPVNMAGYREMFGSFRIPGDPVDTLFTQSIDDLARNAHIIVHRGSAMYKVRVIRDGVLATPAQLLASIQAVLRMTEDDDSPNVSVLTAGDRSSWATHYAKLRKNPTNAASLADIEQALFSLVLDDTPVDGDIDAHFRCVLYGDGQKLWYDQCFSLIVNKDGRSGMHMEHSLSDAGAPSHLWEYVLTYERQHLAKLKPFGTETCVELPAPLRWDLDDVDQAAIESTRAQFNKAASEVAVHVVRWTKWGKGFIKKARMSPDAFVQQALQVTSEAYFGHPVLTYESASARAFQYGRTECVRGATPASHKFVQSFHSKGVPADEKLALLRAAVKTHSRLTVDAMKGYGVDRHMMGLKLAAITAGQAVPELFKHPSFDLQFRMSTSQPPLAQEHVGKLAHLYGPDVRSTGGGFGPVAFPDGVGVSYFLQEDNINFFLSARHPTNPQGEVDRLTAVLQTALDSMHDLVVSS